MTPSLLLLLLCAPGAAAIHEHIAHFFGGGGSYHYNYDENGEIIPFEAKEQHGKACLDVCRETGPCNFCGLSGACCQDGLGGIGCKEEGNPCGADEMCCSADTNLDENGNAIPEVVCINGTIDGETGVNATKCNVTLLDTLKDNYLLVAALLLLIVMVLAFSMSASSGPKGATQMA